MSPHLPRSALGALALAALALGCGNTQPPPAPPRLVVLYATCSLAKGALSPYRSSVSITPAFERFADEAVVFERHQTESGQSGTAFASIFTGAQADEHGVFHHPTQPADGRPLVTEVFAEAGFDTRAFLAHPMASKTVGYARGARGHQGFLRGDDELVQRLLAEIAADPDARAFLATNFTLTHSPYSGAGLDALCAAHPERCSVLENPDAERLRALYDEHGVAFSYDFDATIERLSLTEDEVTTLIRIVGLLYEAGVHELDGHFGRLLDAIEEAGLTDETLIVVTADHGETGYRAGALFQWSHGFQLHPDVLNVPLLLRGPGVAPGRYAAVTRSIDVAPTLIGLAGLPTDDLGMRGVDLSATLREQHPAPELRAFSHTALFPPGFWQRHGETPHLLRQYPDRSIDWMRVALRVRDDFYEAVPRPGGDVEHRLFDLALDRPKTTNRFDADEPTHAAVADELARYRTRLIDAHQAREAARRAGRARRPPQRDIEALRELGYIE